jgi:hypothetical protein
MGGSPFQYRGPETVDSVRWQARTVESSVFDHVFARKKSLKSVEIHAKSVAGPFKPIYGCIQRDALVILSLKTSF